MGIPKPGSDTELVGQTFNRLTVIRLAYRKDGVRYWLCRCSCGTEKPIRQWDFTKGTTYSCGCLAREEGGSLISAGLTKHGHSGRQHSGKKQSRTYVTWNKMKQRCLNPSNDKFANYGGRGITVCERWLTFENFLIDMGERPAGTSLDRINNDGDYKPGNCRWATQRQQSNNMRRNVFVEYRGERLTLSQWARRFKLPRHIVFGRVKLGWNMGRIETTPVQRQE